MTAKAAAARAGMGNTVADRLRELGVSGVLAQMAQRRQIVESGAKCPSATATKGGLTSTRNPTLPARGNRRRTTTRGSSPMAVTSTPGTSGSRTCSATERIMAGA